MPEENKKELPENEIDSSTENENNRPLSPEAEAVLANQPNDSVDSDVDHSEIKKDPIDTEVKTPDQNIKDEPKSNQDSNESSESKGEMAKMNDQKESNDKDKANSGTPTKMSNEKSKDKGNGKFLTFIGLTLVGLFVLFILLMVLVIARGGESSPILTAFGLDPSGIKVFLLGIVNFSFGSLAILFFVIAIIGVFKSLFAKKDDRQARKRGMWMTVIGVIPLILLLFIWLFLYNLIGRIQLSAEQVKAEILLIEPTDISEAQAPLEVTFSSENVIKSLQNKRLSIVGVKWDLNGDGEFETAPNDFTISYLYQTRGNYRVGLAVSVEGEEAPRTYYYPLSIQQALFEANPSSGVAPLDVQFDASQLIPQNAKIKSLDWDFNEDGVYDITGDDVLKPTYTFESIGTFNVHLRYVDENNLVQNYYREIEITKADQPLVSAVIEATPGLTGTAPMAIRFDGQNSKSLKGEIIGYEWDFGDGTDLQSGRSVSHTFNKPGSYKITLTVKDDLNKEASSSVEVVAKGVSSTPIAKIKTDQSLSEEGILRGELPFKVQFDASESEDEDDDIVEYEWDFGKGKKAEGEKPVFTFEEAGEYEVKLTVRDVDQQESSALLKVQVIEPGVKSVINAEPVEGTAPLNVRFDGSTSSTFEGKIVSYEWDFGDGSPKSVTGARITHRYEQVGNYTVRLKVTTNSNESAVSEKVIFVREVPLRACFSPSRTKGEAPLSVTFDSKCSTGSVSSYKWSFGDGDESESRRPAHTFDEPGSYNVTLEVYDDKNNISSFSEVIEVEGE